MISMMINLSNVLKEGNLGNAQDRASLALQLAQYLCSVEHKIETVDDSDNTDDIMKKTTEFVREFAQSVDIEEMEHDSMYIYITLNTCNDITNLICAGVSRFLMNKFTIPSDKTVFFKSKYQLFLSLLLTLQA